MSSKPYLIPLKIFLIRLNMTLNEYFKLSKVPFPVISDDRVIYYKDNDVYVHALRSDDNPLETEVTHKTANSILNSSTSFIDIRAYNPSDTLNCEEIIYRKGSFRIDTNRIRQSEERIQTETINSTDKIYHHKETGKERIISKPSNLLRSNYEFSDVDLVNNENEEFLTKFNSSYYTMSYCLKTNSIVWTPVPPKPVKSNQPTKGNVMSSHIQTIPSTQVTSDVLTSNKNAILVATKLEVGGLALDLLSEQVAKNLPEPFKTLAETNPLFKILIANAINLFVLQTNIEDPKLVALNDAMMTKSYTEMLGKFDLTSILSGVLSGIPSGKLNVLTAKE